MNLKAPVWVCEECLSLRRPLVVEVHAASSDLSQVSLFLVTCSRRSLKWRHQGLNWRFLHAQQVLCHCAVQGCCRAAHDAVWLHQHSCTAENRERLPAPSLMWLCKIFKRILPVVGLAELSALPCCAEGVTKLGWLQGHFNFPVCSWCRWTVFKGYPTSSQNLSPTGSLLLSVPYRIPQGGCTFPPALCLITSWLVLLLLESFHLPCTRGEIIVSLDLSVLGQHLKTRKTLSQITKGGYLEKAAPHFNLCTNFSAKIFFAPCLCQTFSAFHTCIQIGFIY